MNRLRAAWDWYRRLYDGAWPSARIAMWNAHLAAFTLVLFCLWQGWEASTAWGVAALIGGPFLAAGATVLWAYMAAIQRLHAQQRRSTPRS